MIWSKRVRLPALSIVSLLSAEVWSQSETAESAASSIDLVRDADSSPISLGLGLCILSAITLILLYRSVSEQSDTEDE
jgi:hypothetical protein